MQSRLSLAARRRRSRIAPCSRHRRICWSFPTTSRTPASTLHPVRILHGYKTHKHAPECTHRLTTYQETINMPLLIIPYHIISHIWQNGSRFKNLFRRTARTRHTFSIIAYLPLALRCRRHSFICKHVPISTTPLYVSTISPIPKAGAFAPRRLPIRSLYSSPSCIIPNPFRSCASSRNSCLSLPLYTCRIMASVAVTPSRCPLLRDAFCVVSNRTLFPSRIMVPR